MDSSQLPEASAISPFDLTVAEPAGTHLPAVAVAVAVEHFAPPLAAKAVETGLAVPLVLAFPVGMHPEFSSTPGGRVGALGHLLRVRGKLQESQVLVLRNCLRPDCNYRTPWKQSCNPLAVK